MAFADPMQDATDERLWLLSKQIGEILGSVPEQQLFERADLAESFAIWELGPEQLEASPPTLPAKPTPQRHYQIFLDNKPAAYVVARQADAKLEIRKLSISTLADAIDHAIGQIDTHDKEDTPAHFLVAPLCYVYALRLVQTDVIYVISAPPPPSLVPGKKQLKSEMVLSTREFLDRLQRLYAVTRFRSRRR